MTNQRTVIKDDIYQLSHDPGRLVLCESLLLSDSPEELPSPEQLSDHVGVAAVLHHLDQLDHPGVTLTNEKRALGLLTNEKIVLGVLTNKKRLLGVLTNEKRVLRVLTNEKIV